MKKNDNTLSLIRENIHLKDKMEYYQGLYNIIVSKMEELINKEVEKRMNEQ